MKAVNFIKILSFTLLLFSTFYFLNSCKKEDNNPNPNDNGIIFNPSLIYGSVKDIDGNVYKTIKIGNQIWIAENLRTTRYRNGDTIPQTSWPFEDFGNIYSIDPLYGAYYNQLAATDARGLAPVGWHVPSDEEWNILINYLGGDSIAGYKLKETDTLHWNSPNSGTTNESGFTALPGGYSGDYVGIYGRWWSTYSTTDPFAYFRELSCYGAYISRDYHDVCYSYCSVRCVKDN